VRSDANTFMKSALKPMHHHKPPVTARAPPRRRQCRQNAPGVLGPRQRQDSAVDAWSHATEGAKRRFYAGCTAPWPDRPLTRAIRVLLSDNNMPLKMVKSVEEARELIAELRAKEAALSAV